MGQNKTVGCTFSRIGSYGRLGNQLFQYSLVKSVSIRTESDLYLHNNHDLIKYFNPEKLKYKPLSSSYIKFKKFNEKKDFIYDSKVFDIEMSTDFFGYFQHINYFKQNLFEIFESIEPQSKHINEALSFIRQYCKNLDDCCSIHVRRGDYLEQKNKDVFRYLNTDHYLDTLTNIPNGIVMFIVSDDIEYTKNEFKDFYQYNTIIFVENKNPIINFYIMYLCRINIMANSTFSYWASLLSDKNNQKSVYYPKDWMIYNPQPTIFKNNWKVITNKWLNLFSTR